MRMIAAAVILPLKFLAELGIGAENDGCYSGSWFANGAVQSSHNPATGKELAHVRQGTEADYERCLASMTAAKKAWAEVRPIDNLFMCELTSGETAGVLRLVSFFDLATDCTRRTRECGSFKSYHVRW